MEHFFYVGFGFRNRDTFLILRPLKGHHNIKMLPTELFDLIHSFVDKFNLWESLPDPKRIKKLAAKSNHDLVTRLTLSPFLPNHFVSRPKFTFGFEVSSENVKHIENAICGSVECCWQTSALFWLFIENETTMYHGCYTQIFENSLFYQLVNIISLTPEEATELGFLYLIKNCCTSGVQLYLH